jgi:hypothetical protein
MRSSSSARARVADFAFGFRRVLASKVMGAAKAIVVALEGVKGEDDDEANKERSEDTSFFGALGLVARPLPNVEAKDATPTNPEGYAEVICARFGDEDLPICHRDLRLCAKLNPQEGEIALVQYGGGFLSLRPASDGLGTQASLYVPRLKSDGSVEMAHGLFVDPTDGGSLSMLHGGGAGFFLTADGAMVKNHAGDAFVDLNETQARLSAPTMFVSTGSFFVYINGDLGSHVLFMDASDDSIAIAHRMGQAVTMASDGSIAIKSPSGSVSLVVTDTEVIINGNLKVQGKGFFGNPALWASPSSSVLVGISGMAGIPSQALVASPNFP